MLVCKCTLSLCYRSIMELSVASVEVKKTAVPCKLSFIFMSRSFGYRGDRRELVPSFRAARREPRTQLQSDLACCFHSSSQVHTIISSGQIHILPTTLSVSRGFRIPHSAVPQPRQIRQCNTLEKCPAPSPSFPLLFVHGILFSL